MEQNTERAAEAVVLSGPEYSMAEQTENLHKDLMTKGGLLKK